MYGGKICLHLLFIDFGKTFLKRQQQVDGVWWGLESPLVQAHRFKYKELKGTNTVRPKLAWKLSDLLSSLLWKLSKFFQCKYSKIKYLLKSSQCFSSFFFSAINFLWDNFISIKLKANLSENIISSLECKYDKSTSFSAILKYVNNIINRLLTKLWLCSREKWQFPATGWVVILIYIHSLTLGYSRAIYNTIESQLWILPIPLGNWKTGIEFQLVFHLGIL